MNIPIVISELIYDIIPVSIAIEDTTDFYKDLGFDSITFVTLLICVEEKFNISFAIAEMERCLVVKRLIELVEKKIGDHHD